MRIYAKKRLKKTIAYAAAALAATATAVSNLRHKVPGSRQQQQQRQQHVIGRMCKCVGTYVRACR